jgi:hypothetical protein
MVEVFKTNVNDWDEAKMLIEKIHKTFNGYTANFDLDDCDKILRVKSTTGFVEATLLVQLLENLGFAAEVLPDDDEIFGQFIRMTKLNKSTLN